MVLLLALLLGCDSDDDMREIQACADEGVNVFAPAGRIPVAALVCCEPDMCSPTLNYSADLALETLTLDCGCNDTSRAIVAIYYQEAE